MQYLATLRLLFDGGVFNEYRIRHERVEFRTNAKNWRVLSDSDIELHFRFDTEVARWLRRHRVEANPHSAVGR